METSIIVAIITGLCAVIGNALMYAKKTREDDAKQQVWQTKVEMQLDGLSEKVDEAIKRLDEHNNLADKFKDVSSNFAVAIAELRTELKNK